jgi:hypothetical protein
MTEQTGEYGAMTNGYPKHVVSTSLEEPLEWNNSTLIKDDVTEEVSRLKRRPGKEVLTFGSDDLVNTLMRHELINEYRVMVFPVVVGSGKRLFRGGIETTALKLVETKTFGSGVVVFTYRPAGNEGEGSRSNRHLRHRSHRKHSLPSDDRRGNNDIAVCAANVTQRCLKAGRHEIQINLAYVLHCSGVHLFEHIGTERIEV